MWFMNELSVITIQSEWLRAGGIFATFLIASVVISVVWNRIFSRLMAKTRSNVDDMVLEALRRLVVWGLIVAGGYFAFLEVSASQKGTIIWIMLGRGFTIAWVILVIATAIRLSSAFSLWRIDRANGADSIRDVTTRVHFIRKLLNAAVMVVGGLYVLTIAGVDISPIIAGGAFTGIIVGVALQDTLSNVFAGFFLNFDRPIKIGDFIRLDTDQEGYVEDIGWRYSRVRLLANNLLIIPNNKLSQSVITNYSLPNRSLSVSVPCTISHENDLDQVEAIAMEVAKQVQQSVDETDQTYQPQVRFKDFGTSSISLVTVLRSKEVGAQNRLKHQFIKDLHRAFCEAGIKLA
jgi:small-conductance mechanosensitive channel